MENIKNIVAGVIGRMSTSKGGVLEDIHAAWQKISGDESSKVVDFKEGRVVIGADSSMRLVKLNLNRESLLKELQIKFPSIVKISFKVVPSK